MTVEVIEAEEFVNSFVPEEENLFGSEVFEEHDDGDGHEISLRLGVPNNQI